MDLDKIKTNVKSMIDQGATEQEIDQYIDYKGATVDQVREHKISDGTFLGLPLVGKVGKAVGDFATSAYQTVAGNQDPRYANVGHLESSLMAQDLPQEGGSIQPELDMVKLAGASDESYGNVFKQMLQDKGLFIRSERDENGYEIIIYKGLDGKERQGYVNKPGLDAYDVERFGYSLVPYVSTGGVTGVATKGASVGTRMASQAFAGAGTSIGSDVVVDDAGGDQGIDYTKAAITGATAGFFEGLSGPIARAWQSIFQRKKAIGPDGKLTQDAIEQAQKAGLRPQDLQDMDARLAQEFLDQSKQVLNPEELARKTTADEFGIQLTKAQRTRAPKDIANEERLAKDLGDIEGGGAVLREFTKNIQREQVESAIEGIGGKMAPGRIQDVTEAGANLQANLQRAGVLSKAKEKALWRKVDDIVVNETMLLGNKKKGIPSLSDEITRAVKNPLSINKEATPTTHAMLNYLNDIVNQSKSKIISEKRQAGFLSDLFKGPDKVIKGKTGAQYTMLKGEPEDLTVDGVRKILGSFISTAKEKGNRTDLMHAKDIYKGFLNWNEAVAKKMVDESPEALVSYRASVLAREFTAKTREVFEKNATNDTAGAIIQKILDSDTTPEGVIKNLFTSVTSEMKDGTVPALQRIKKIFQKYNMPEAWGDVRLAYFLKLVKSNTRTNNPYNRAGFKTPNDMRKTIQTAFDKQGSAIKVLFNEAEQRELKRFANVMGDVDLPKMNPSGSAYEVERNIFQMFAQKFIKGKATREKMLQGRPIRGSFYQLLADMPIFGGVVKGFSREKAKSKFLSQKLPLKPKEGFGTVGSVIGSKAGAEDE